MTATSGKVPRRRPRTPFDGRCDAARDGGLRPQLAPGSLSRESAPPRCQGPCRAGAGMRVLRRRPRASAARRFRVPERVPERWRRLCLPTRACWSRIRASARTKRRAQSGERRDGGRHGTIPRRALKLRRGLRRFEVAVNGISRGNRAGRPAEHGWLAQPLPAAHRGTLGARRVAFAA